MNTTIFFAGTGNMGRAILRGLLNAGTDAKNIFFFDPSDKAAEAVSALGCVRVSSFAEGIEKANVTFLCVKPQIFKLVAAEWKAAAATLKSEKTFISIMAGVVRKSLIEILGEKNQVLRVMPNLPLTVGKGSVGLATDGVSEDTLKIAEEIFGNIGVTCRVAESLMDAVTGLSGSAPPYPRWRKGWPHPRCRSEARPRHHRRQRRTCKTVRQKPERPLRHGLLSSRHDNRWHRCPRRRCFPQHTHQGRRRRHQP
jgi:pyrroline-5-carboxylate reductase